MNRNRRLGGYLLITLVLFGAILMGPRAWATPSQARPGQGFTVPTMTPSREWSPEPTTAVPPTDRPTDRPTGRPSGGNTATPLPPGATPTPPAARAHFHPHPRRGYAHSWAAPAQSWRLVKAVDRLEAWPGATVGSP